MFNTKEIFQKVNFHIPKVSGSGHGDKCFDASERHWPIVGGLATSCIHFIQAQTIQWVTQSQEYSG